jgi:hypothetical protein
MILSSARDKSSLEKSHLLTFEISLDSIFECSSDRRDVVDRTATVAGQCRQTAHIFAIVHEIRSWKRKRMAIIKENTDSLNQLTGEVDEQLHDMVVTRFTDAIFLEVFNERQVVG